MSYRVIQHLSATEINSGHTNTYELGAGVIVPVVIDVTCAYAPPTAINAVIVIIMRLLVEEAISSVAFSDVRRSMFDTGLSLSW